jgi:hypothetical protein
MKCVDRRPRCEAACLHSLAFLLALTETRHARVPARCHCAFFRGEGIIPLPGVRQCGLRTIGQGGDREISVPTPHGIWIVRVKRHRKGDKAEYDVQRVAE